MSIREALVRLVSVGFLLVLVSSCESPQQDPEVIGDALACARCSIQMDTAATLGSDSGDAALLNPLTVAEDPNGRYWVFANGAMPVVFNPDGGYFATIGRKGEGPGEMLGPQRLFTLPSDTTAVVDRVRLHLWGPDYDYIRTLHIPLLGTKDALALQWPSTVVVNALDPYPGRLGNPLHVVDFSAPRPEVRRSFGGSDQEMTTSMMYTQMPRMLTAARSGYWSVSIDLYRIHRYTPSNDIDVAIVRRPEWFAERSSLSTGTYEIPPAPACVGAEEDESGLLWVYCRVASPEYRSAYATEGSASTPTDGAADVVGDVIDYHLLFHTWVEVIDPARRVVVARQKLPFSVLSVLRSRKVATVSYSAGGDPLVKVVRLVLIGMERAP